MSPRLLALLLMLVPAAAHASARLKPIELHLSGGVGGLQTPDASEEFVYRHSGGEVPLSVSTTKGTFAPALSLSVYFNLPSLDFGRLQLSPYISGDALLGSLAGFHGTAGLRLMRKKGVLRPWVAAGIGFAQATGEIAVVPGTGEGIAAPDGTRIPGGEPITASASAFGGDFRAGVSLAFSDTWGLSLHGGYSLFGALSEWEAKATNVEGNRISLGRLSGFPPVSVSGLNAFLGFTYSYSQ